MKWTYKCSIVNEIFVNNKIKKDVILLSLVIYNASICREKPDQTFNYFIEIYCDIIEAKDISVYTKPSLLKVQFYTTCQPYLRITDNIFFSRKCTYNFS